MKIKFILLLSIVTQIASAQCVDVFHLHRDVVGGLVDHEFIGMEFTGGSAGTYERVFGLTKGNSDLVHFQAIMRNQISHQGADYVGSVCGEIQVAQTVEIARSITQRLQKKHENWLYYTGRMVVTPLVGKPCGNAADEIEAAIVSYWQN